MGVGVLQTSQVYQSFKNMAGIQATDDSLQKHIQPVFDWQDFLKVVEQKSFH
jgi:hypothetical protein